MLDIQERKTNPNKLHYQSKQLTCIYRNESSIIQIVRISQPSIAFFERSVLPNQCINFSTSENALLEIYEGVMSGLVHADTIPCYQLAMSMDTDIKTNFPSTKEPNKESTKNLQSLFARVA